jgi:hypothetical protein
MTRGMDKEKDRKKAVREERAKAHGKLFLHLRS